MAQVPSHTHTFTFDIPSASAAEVAAGTDDSKAVTPLALAGAGETFLGLLGGGAAGIDVFQSVTPADARTVLELGTASTSATGDFATAAQGTLADTAVQPADLATVATTGQYTDIVGTPTLGTAAAQDSTAFATAAQGLLADSAVQPGDGEAVPIGGTTGQVLAKASATDGDTFWTIAGQGDIISTNNGSDFADPEATLDNLGGLAKADNLAGLTAPDTALTNLGISTAALQNFVKAASASTAFSALALALSGGTQSRSQIDRTQEKRYSLFEWIPAALIAGILAGTNTTPVTSYVQAALNSGKPLSVPIGTFLLDAPVDVPSNVSLVGYNKKLCKFRMADAVNNYLFTANASTGIDFQDFLLDGNQAGQTATEPTGGLIYLEACYECSFTGLVGRDGFNAAILTRSCWDIDIHHNDFDGMGSHAISIAGVTGAKCYRIRMGFNSIKNTVRSAVNISQADYCTASGNTTFNTGKGAAGETDEAKKGAAFRVTNDSRFNVIFGNTSDDTYRGVQFGDDTGTNGEVMHNIAACNTITNSQLQAILIQGPHNKAIGNTIVEVGLIDDGTLYDAIRISDGAGQAAHDAVVSNNTCIDSGGRMGYGVSDEGTTGGNNVITDNNVEGAVTGTVRARNVSNTVHGNNPSGGGAVITAAATTVVPDDGTQFTLSGVAQVENINYGRIDRLIILRSGSGNTFIHGTGNLRLRGAVNKTVPAGETISFVWYNTAWFEV